MILEDGLPEQIDKLSQGKDIEISIDESDRAWMEIWGHFNGTVSPTT